MNPTNYYTRMFPRLPAQGATNPQLEQGLVDLGAKMIASQSDRPDPEDPPPMQGYTYFGQFIDHDLTLDLTPLDAATRNVERTRNFRTPFLDLDHVYGGGPNLSPFLYRSDSRPGEERFLIGETRPTSMDGQDFPSSRNDLPRNSEGIALTGEPREDENLIIAQLHVAFLKLHNRTLDWLEGDKAIRNNAQGRFQIPVEFSVAAFRFGHAMVRNEYFFNENHDDARLYDDLLQLTGTPGTARRAVPSLPADWVIDWKFFFLMEFEPHEVRHSSAIHPALAEGLHHLGQQTKLFNAPMMGPIPRSASHHKIQTKQESRLPVRTLLRGARVGLPSGQCVAKKVGKQRPAIRTITDDEIAHGPHEKILKKHGFHQDTPLWYYILKEAEVLQKGTRLGAVGSRIVADVLIKALRADANSYVRVNPNWTPSLPARYSDPKMFGMADLLRFASGTTRT
jgi:hypothetical protein